MSRGMFEGSPDDWWGGHDWDVWWAWLPPQDRQRLLDLAWGEEPAPLLGDRLTRLRGAVREDIEDYTVVLGGRPTPRTRTVHRATDELHVFLEEKRNEPGRG